MNLQKSKDNYNLIFKVDIFDGYSFRQLIEFYKSNCSSIPFVFKKNGLSIISGNGINTMVIDTTLFKENLLKYYINSDLFNDQDYECHNIMPNLDDFLVYINSIQKQGSVCIFQYYEEPSYLYIQIYGGSKTSNPLVKVKLEEFNIKKYNFYDNIKDTDSPNAKTSLTSFCSACETSIKIKKNEIILKCFPNFVKFNIGNESLDEIENIIWYNDDLESDVLLNNTSYDLKINNIIKNLSKLKNINTKGIIKFFCKCEGVIRLDLNVGISGITSIYLF